LLLEFALKKYVWDTSAIINIKEPNENGYSPGHSLMKDLRDGWIKGEYQNIFPTIAVFEVQATVSKKHRKGEEILREFYILDENSTLYDVNEDLIAKSIELFTTDGFDMLYGADLIFACIAYIEDAYLVTMDRKLANHVSKHIKVIDLNLSKDSAQYHEIIG
jgi:predicted nucleic acid-binding protein